MSVGNGYLAAALGLKLEAEDARNESVAGAPTFAAVEYAWRELEANIDWVDMAMAKIDGVILNIKKWTAMGVVDMQRFEEALGEIRIRRDIVRAIRNAREWPAPDNWGGGGI